MIHCWIPLFSTWVWAKCFPSGPWRHCWWWVSHASCAQSCSDPIISGGRVTGVGIVTWVVQICPHPTPLTLKRRNQGSRWNTFCHWILLLRTRLCLFQQPWFPVVLSFYTCTQGDNWPGWNFLLQLQRVLLEQKPDVRVGKVGRDQKGGER